MPNLMTVNEYIDRPIPSERIKDMLFVGIDPGPAVSSMIVADGDEKPGGKLNVVNRTEFNNTVFPDVFSVRMPHRCVTVVEWVTPRGHPVGRETLDTLFWASRMVQWMSGKPILLKLAPRSWLGRHLCGDGNANDSMVRAACLEVFSPWANGGGSNPVIGLKSEPGPLYGVTHHLWIALGLVLALREAAADESKRGTFTARHDERADLGLDDV